jgi:hypothetical protein
MTSILDWASGSPERARHLTPHIAEAHEKAYQAGEETHCAFLAGRKTEEWKKRITPRRPRSVDAMLALLEPTDL